MDFTNANFDYISDKITILEDREGKYKIVQKL